MIFRSLELKAPGGLVIAIVVCQACVAHEFFPFSTSSQELLSRFQQNLVGSIQMGSRFKVAKEKGLAVIGTPEGVDKFENWVNIYKIVL